MAELVQLPAPLENRPVESEKTWYFQEPKTQEPKGPWSVSQLRVRWQRHRIDGLTMVWRTGLDAWKPLRDVEELKEKLQAPDEAPDEAEDDAEEVSGTARGVKRKRRIHLDSMPITHTYTSNQGVLLVYDTVDHDWKTSEIYEDLVSQEALPEVEEGGLDASEAPTMQTAKAGADKDADMTLEAQEALKELLGEVEGGSGLCGGDGVSVLGLTGAAKKAKILADAAAAEAKAKVDAGGVPLTAEQEAKAKKKHDYRERKKLKRQAGLFIKTHTKTNVYVSGLPPDVTLQELEPAFKRGGVLKVDVETGDSKIRIYRDAEGRCKGDALVSYANAESVELAVRFLHEFELRPDCRIAVQEADFDEKDAEELKERNAKLTTQELKEIASKRNIKEERKKYKAAKNMEKEAVSWSGDMDDGTGRKIVLLKHMFSLEEAETEGPEFYPELEEEVKEECEKIGQVAKVTPIAGHKQGIVTVKFKSSAEAEECIRVMDGRFFGGQTVEASFYDGKTDLRALGGGCVTKKPSVTAPELKPASATVVETAAAVTTDEEMAVASPEAAEPEKAPFAPDGKTWDEWLAGDGSDSDDSDLVIQTEE